MSTRRSIKDHYKNVAQLGCAITRSNNVVLHHCTGGSMIPRYGLSGMSKRGISDWLVIPLRPDLHTGSDYAFHEIGADDWERRFEDQFVLLCWVNSMLDYDIFDQ